MTFIRFPLESEQCDTGLQPSSDVIPISMHVVPGIRTSFINPYKLFPGKQKTL